MGLVAGHISGRHTTRAGGTGRKATGHRRNNSTHLAGRWDSKPGTLAYVIRAQASKL